MGNNPSCFNGVVDEGTEWERERERWAGRIGANSVYRLPTEAEWEYACRAWTSTRFSYGDDPGYTDRYSGETVGYTNLTNYAWYDVNSEWQTHPVGQKLPNSWGLYDMHGNVWEWCQDYFANYVGGIALDPQGPPETKSEYGNGHVIRGSDWGFWHVCRSAIRGNDSSQNSGNPKMEATTHEQAKSSNDIGYCGGRVRGPELGKIGPSCAASRQTPTSEPDGPGV